jgi:hypothetical protein
MHADAGDWAADVIPPPPGRSNTVSFHLCKVKEKSNLCPDLDNGGTMTRLVISDSGCTLESPRELLKIPVSRLFPRLVTSESLESLLVTSNIFKVPMWFQCPAKVKNQWLSWKLTVIFPKWN